MSGITLILAVVMVLAFIAGNDGLAIIMVLVLCIYHRETLFDALDDALDSDTTILQESEIQHDTIYMIRTEELDSFDYHIKLDDSCQAIITDGLEYEVKLNIDDIPDFIECLNDY